MTETNQFYSPGRVTYSPDETAAALGVSRVTVYKMLANGTLRKAKLGRRTLIAASDIESLHRRLADAA